MKVSQEELNQEYTSKMELLGYLNPYAAEGARKKDTVEFRTFRAPTRRNGGTYMTIEGVARIQVPKLRNNKLVTNRHTGEVEMEEATILYIPGTRSIFLDDLREETGQTDKELMERATHIELQDGYVNCSYSEQNKIAYLRTFGGNVESRGRQKGRHSALLYEKDMTSSAQRYLKQQLPKHNVAGFVVDKINARQNAALWAVLAALRNQSVKACMDIFQETTTMQAQVMKIAKDSPERLESIIFSEEGHNKIILLEAIEKGEIRQLTDEWVTREGKRLAYINKGADPIEALVRLMPHPEMEALKAKFGRLLDGLQTDLTERDRVIDELLKDNERLRKEAELSRAIPTSKLKELANDKGYSMAEIEKVFIGIKEAEGLGPVEFKRPNWFKSDYFPKSEDGELKSYRLDQIVEHYLQNQSDFAKLVTVLGEAKAELEAEENSKEIAEVKE